MEWTKIIDVFFSSANNVCTVYHSTVNNVTQLGDEFAVSIVSPSGNISTGPIAGVPIV